MKTIPPKDERPRWWTNELEEALTVTFRISKYGVKVWIFTPRKNPDCELK